MSTKSPLGDPELKMAKRRGGGQGESDPALAGPPGPRSGLGGRRRANRPARSSAIFSNSPGLLRGRAGFGASLPAADRDPGWAGWASARRGWTEGGEARRKRKGGRRAGRGGVWGVRRVCGGEVEAKRGGRRRNESARPFRRPRPDGKSRAQPERSIKWRRRRRWPRRLVGEVTPAASLPTRPSLPLLPPVLPRPAAAPPRPSGSAPPRLHFPRSARDRRPPPPFSSSPPRPRRRPPSSPPRPAGRPASSPSFSPADRISQCDPKRGRGRRPNDVRELRRPGGGVK